MSRIARGLRSITLSLQGMNDAGEQDIELVSSLQNQFGKLGISLTGTDGQLKSTYDILSELSQIWGTLDKNTQSWIASTVAGKTQVDVFNSVISNFGTAVGATETALNSSGSALKENAKVMDSIQKKIEAFQSAFENLSNNLISSGLIKMIIDLGTNLIKLLNNPIGIAIIQLGALKLSFTTLSKILGSNKISGAIATIGKTLKTVFVSDTLSEISSLKMLGITLDLVGVKLKAFSVTAKGLTSIWGALALVFYGLYQWAEESWVTLEEQKEVVDDLTDAVSALQGEYDALRAKEGKTSEDKARLQSLEAELAVNKELLRIESQRYLNQKYSAGRSSVSGMSIGQIMGASEFSAQQDLELGTNTSGLFGGAQGTSQITEATAKLQELNTKFEQGKISLADYKAESADLVKILVEVNKDIESNIANGASLDDVQQALYNSSKNMIDAYMGIIGANDSTSTSYEEYANTIDSLTKEFESLKGAYNSIIQASSELNNSGQISVDTYVNLINSSDEYLMALLAEQRGEGNVAIAAQNAARAKLLELTQTKFLAIAKRISSGESLNEISAMMSVANQAQITAQSLLNLTEAYNATTEAALKKQYAEATSLQEAQELGMKLDQINKLRVVATGLADTYNNINWDSFTQNAYDAGVSAGENLVKGVSDGVNEALKAEKDMYDKAFSYIKSLAQKEIDVLEEKKKAEEDYWDEKISALNKQNDAIDDQIELEKALANLREAKSQKIRVYRDGQFVYEENRQAVAEAQERVDELRREKQLQDQIDKLNKLKDQAVSALDAQIKYWGKYKDEWSSVASSYENSQNKLMAEQLFGIDFEKQAWETRLGNLQRYVGRYIAINNQLNSGSNSVSSSGGAPSGGGNSVSAPSSPVVGSSVTVKRTASKFTTGQTMASFVKGGTYSVLQVSGDGSKILIGINGTPTGWVAKTDLEGYAKGSPSIPSDQMALVGDAPNTEMAIPSKLNGIPMNLSKGMGIVPATLTSNLMDWGRFSPYNFKTSATSSSAVYNFKFDKIELPNVSDANSFVNDLKNRFVSLAKKEANK